MPKHIANYVGFTTLSDVSTGGAGNKGFWNLFDQFFFRAKNEWATIPISATGGAINLGPNGYTYHIFSSPGSFTVNSGSGTIEVLIVAGGGGGGGGYYSGGAGGGGVLYGTNIAIGPGPYPVVVGSGGAGSPGLSGSSTAGGNSSFNSVTALGGGKGGSGPGTNDGNATLAGGCGGGASYYVFPGVGPASPQPAPVSYVAYGQDGGASRDGGVTGGSGGGAGQPGAASPTQKGGNGQPFPGFAKPFMPSLPAPAPSMGPTVDFYAGGGSGGTPGVSLAGGLGGGGTGAPGGSGGAGVGSLGGGGGGTGNPQGAGGAGGSGSVIIRYIQ